MSFRKFRRKVIRPILDLHSSINILLGLIYVPNLVDRNFDIYSVNIYTHAHAYTENHTHTHTHIHRHTDTHTHTHSRIHMENLSCQVICRELQLPVLCVTLQAGSKIQLIGLREDQSLKILFLIFDFVLGYPLRLRGQGSKDTYNQLYVEFQHFSTTRLILNDWIGLDCVWSL